MLPTQAVIHYVRHEAVWCTNKTNEVSQLCFSIHRSKSQFKGQFHSDGVQHRWDEAWAHQRAHHDDPMAGERRKALFGEDCWTDLDEVTTRALEVSWRNGAQVPVTVDEWPNYVYFVGAQLKQTNVTTTKQRSLRRLMILDQDHEQEASLPGWCCVCVYIYISIYICVCVHLFLSIYIYIYIDIEL